MDLYEYQARDMFAAHGVPVLPGGVATDAAGARRLAQELGGRAVVKAQVKIGGRGKAGGVKLAADPDEAERHAQGILGMDIRGHRVRQVMVTEPSEIVAEYYFSFLLDRANRTFLAIASAEGGVEIEQLAEQRPEALARVPIDPISGVDRETAMHILEQARFPAEVVDSATSAVMRLWDTFRAEDATLVEVNPLVRGPNDTVLALDAKITLDNNSAFRHPEHAELADTHAADPLEADAAAQGLNYVKLDGQVGIIGNGAGLVMSTLDVVDYAGRQHNHVKPANFLDIGGGASAEVMAAGLQVILSDSDVRSVFVNVFGGITSCDAVASGIVSAFDLLAQRGEPVDKKLVVRLDGNNAAAGRVILRDAELPGVEQVETMDEAADRAATIAATT